jgi:hypothetical protein
LFFATDVEAIIYRPKGVVELTNLEKSGVVLFVLGMIFFFTGTELPDVLRIIAGAIGTLGLGFILSGGKDEK